MPPNRRELVRRAAEAQRQAKSAAHDRDPAGVIKRAAAEFTSDLDVAFDELESDGLLTFAEVSQTLPPLREPARRFGQRPGPRHGR